MNIKKLLREKVIIVAIVSFLFLIFTFFYIDFCIKERTLINKSKKIKKEFLMHVGTELKAVEMEVSRNLDTIKDNIETLEKENKWIDYEKKIDNISLELALKTEKIIMNFEEKIKELREKRDLRLFNEGVKNIIKKSKEELRKAINKNLKDYKEIIVKIKEEEE